MYPLISVAGAASLAARPWSAAQQPSIAEDLGRERKPMTKTKLRIAIAEAERFLARARVALAQKGYDHQDDLLFGSMHNSAAIRASLDLSRALAGMRKP